MIAVKDMKPLVTVVAICYNQEKYVEATLNSIKAQTYSNIQLIISDDGSTDKTKEIVRRWIATNFPSAIFLDHKVNQGITKNYNSTLPYITGEYVKLIGCDDVLLPDTIEVLMQMFSDLSEEFGVIYSDMYRIDEEGKLIDEVGIVEKRGHQVYSGYVYKEMIQKPFVTAASMIFRRAVLDKLKRFNEKVFYEDHDFYLRASKYFKFYYIPEKLVQYRVHSGSQINSSSRIRYFHNTYYVYYTNYDNRPGYKSLFVERLLFCIKNFYALKFRDSFSFSLKAFLKTGNLQFIKYSVASIPYYFSGNRH